MTKSKSLHAEASLHRKLVLFAVQLEGVVSRLGHARRTCSFRPLMTFMEENHNEMYRQLPAAFAAAHRG